MFYTQTVSEILLTNQQKYFLILTTLAKRSVVECQFNSYYLAHHKSR